MKQTPLRFRSKKRQRIMVERRALVAKILEERPWCELCLSLLPPDDDMVAVRGPVNPSTEVHEVVSRARWPAGVLVESNCRILCHIHHSWITENPAQATAEGWIKRRER